MLKSEILRLNEHKYEIMLAEKKKLQKNKYIKINAIICIQRTRIDYRIFPHCTRSHISIFILFFFCEKYFSLRPI